jgi:cobalt-zinc-cadmium efflux system outer membrane protein
MIPTRPLLLATTLGFATACVHDQPQPIAAAHTASQLQQRSLPKGTLNRHQLTTIALRQHPDIEVAHAKLATAQAALITAGARPNPTLSFASTNISHLLRGLSPWTNGFNLDVPIETAGKRHHRIDQAQSLLNLAALNLSTTERLVASRLRSSFLTLYAASEREKITRQIQAHQEESTRLLDQRIKVGEASRVDSMQARLSFNQSQLQSSDAQKITAEAQATLASALGISVAALKNIHLSFTSIDSLPSLPNEQILRRSALLQRSDVLALLADYAASEAFLRLEISKQWPDLHLGPGYSFDQGQDKWTIGFNLTLPVFDQNRGPIAEALAKRREAAANFIAIQAKALGELELALASYRGSLAKMITANQLLAAEEKQLASLETRFQAGETDRLARGLAEVQLQTTRLARLEAVIETARALGSLEDATGKLLSP